jgi:hypothetical protein
VEERRVRWKGKVGGK